MITPITHPTTLYKILLIILAPAIMIYGDVLVTLHGMWIYSITIPLFLLVFYQLLPSGHEHTEHEPNHSKHCNKCTDKATTRHE